MYMYHNNASMPRGIEVQYSSWRRKWGGLVTLYGWAHAPPQDHLLLQTGFWGKKRRTATQALQGFPKSIPWSLQDTAKTKGWEILASDQRSWRPAIHQRVKAVEFEGKRQQDLDQKRQASKERKPDPVQSVACPSPSCGRICASDFRLRSHMKSQWHRHRSAMDFHYRFF